MLSSCLVVARVFLFCCYLTSGFPSSAWRSLQALSLFFIANSTSFLVTFFFSPRTLPFCEISGEPPSIPIFFRAPWIYFSPKVKRVNSRVFFPLTDFSKQEALFPDSSLHRGTPVHFQRDSFPLPIFPLPPSRMRRSLLSFLRFPTKPAASHLGVPIPHVTFSRVFLRALAKGFQRV